MTVVKFTINQLVNVRVHLGESKRHYSSYNNLFLLGLRNNNLIFNLDISLYIIRLMLNIIENIIFNRGRLLFIVNSMFIQNNINLLIKPYNNFFSITRWIGGLLTNYKHILINKVKKKQVILENLTQEDTNIKILSQISIIKKILISPNINLKYLNNFIINNVISSKSKKEKKMGSHLQLIIQYSIDLFKLLNNVQNNKSMKFNHLVMQKLNLIKVSMNFILLDSLFPQTLFIFDLKRQDSVRNEIKKIRIPSIALIDSRISPLLIDYPIPTNTSSFEAFLLFAKLINNAMHFGLKKETINYLQDANFNFLLKKN